MPAQHLLQLILFIICDTICISWAQQSAAGQDTLIGIVGRDFVMMGADSSSSGGGGIALTSSNVDKISLIHDGMSRHSVGHHNPIRQSSAQQAIAVGFAGDAADADRLMGTLKTHTQVREYEAGIGNDVLCVFDGQADSLDSRETLEAATSPAGLDAEAVANLARNEISSRMRSRQPLQLCLLVGGMVRCNNPFLSEVEVIDRVQKQISTGSAAFKSKSNNHSNGKNHVLTNRGDCESDSSKPLNNDEHWETNPFLTPKLFWLDQYGSLQDMRFASHGYGSNFAYSVLDQRYRNAMSRQEAVDLIQECFAQLRKRYVINSPQPPRIKCIDRFGVTEIREDK